MEMIIGSCFALTSVIIAAISQIILKKAADKTANIGFVRKFMNVTVIMAYVLMLGSSFCGMLSLRYMELNLMPIFQATSFFWIILLSRIVLKENVTKRHIISICIIFSGILIYVL